MSTAEELRRCADSPELSGTHAGAVMLDAAAELGRLTHDLNDAHEIIRHSLAAKEVVRLRSVLLQLDLTLEQAQKVTREALADATGT